MKNDDIIIFEFENNSIVRPVCFEVKKEWFYKSLAFLKFPNDICLKESHITIFFKVNSFFNLKTRNSQDSVDGYIDTYAAKNKVYFTYEELAVKIAKTIWSFYNIKDSKQILPERNIKDLCVFCLQYMPAFNTWKVCFHDDPEE